MLGHKGGINRLSQATVVTSKSSNSAYGLLERPLNGNPVQLYQPASQAIERTCKFPKAQPNAMKSHLMTTGVSPSRGASEGL